MLARSLKIAPDNRDEAIEKKVIEGVDGGRVLEDHEVLVAIDLEGLGIYPAHSAINRQSVGWCQSFA